ncbi:MAG TPA: glycerol kinase GlpK [Chloroflexia bacterium]|nr:glycerol kinase GlpK [Chloroflexia bacterium]
MAANASPASRYILALDQGTTSSRAIIFDRAGHVVGQCSREFRQLYPQPGWVEHDPEEIWASQLEVARKVLRDSDIAPGRIAAIGVTNQRETTLAWDSDTGEPICNAIVWQDRRTAQLCDSLKESGWGSKIQAKTGLVIDPYFSGTKLKWILDNVPGAAQSAASGKLRFGTVDTFLVWRMSGGSLYITDYSNASRTMLFNIHELRWDEEILAGLDIPASILPTVYPSSHLYGYAAESFLGEKIPITGVAGDQQAATFGQACYSPGMAKNTYGTGCFLLMNTGRVAVPSKHNLLTTVGWGLGGEITYCLEGSVFSAGAVVQYLRDSLRLIDDAAQTETLALSVESSGGVYFVPAFVGMGAPYWDPYARGAVLGLTRGSGRAEIVRAALESVAYQTRDVLEAMVADSGEALTELRVDGGMVVNNFLMQFQADILGVPVVRSAIGETTALGAAYLAGLAVDYWQSEEEIARNWSAAQVYEPRIDPASREALYRNWGRAVERSLRWEQP